MSDPFTNHIATYWQSPSELGILVERLVFKKPQSSDFFIEFVCYRNNLIVTGDLYEAVYAVNNHQTLLFWAGCDAHYLSSKMRDLDGYARIGRDHWNSQKAETFLKGYLNELKQEENKERLEAWECDSPLEHIASKEEWHVFLSTREAYDIFGSDYGEYASVGYEIHPQVTLHTDALRLAVAQLKGNGIKLAEKG